jgi:hypothetical protein
LKRQTASLYPPYLFSVLPFFCSTFSGLTFFGLTV